jgi:hypothetical protein
MHLRNVDLLLPDYMVQFATKNVIFILTAVQLEILCALVIFTKLQELNFSCQRIKLH